MSINLNDPEVERTLHELSKEAGESLAEAATIAIRERLERVRELKRVRQQRSLQAVLDLIDEARRSPPLDARSLKQIRDGLWGA